MLCLPKLVKQKAVILLTLVSRLVSLKKAKMVFRLSARKFLNMNLNIYYNWIESARSAGGIETNKNSLKGKIEVSF